MKEYFPNTWNQGEHVRPAEEMKEGLICLHSISCQSAKGKFIQYWFNLISGLSRNCKTAESKLIEILNIIKVLTSLIAM